MRALLLVLTRMVTGCSGSREQKNEILKGKSKKETKTRAVNLEWRSPDPHRPLLRFEAIVVSFVLSPVV